MRRPVVTLSAASAILMSGAALAHHGWGSYDASRTMVIENPVSSLDWQNQHVHIGVSHEGATWHLVIAPPFRMQARGLTPEMLKAGTRVRAVGYPSTRVERELRAERIV
ncbi:MAG TPA: DUF6152 family protein, partial [Microvirga sp.]|nr:DUF6152 family protein [Microvirga sp.]